MINLLHYISNNILTLLKYSPGMAANMQWSEKVRHLPPYFSEKRA